MKITVTQEDIDNGERGDECRCPIALALNRIVPGGKVHSYSAELPKGREEIPLPSAACYFVEKFDTGKPVQPFTFDLPA